MENVPNDVKKKLKNVSLFKGVGGKYSRYMAQLFLPVPIIQRNLRIFLELGSVLDGLSRISGCPK
jgi:hypothetical protein